ncbi:hypothetical protein K490DRAFT_72379 [Saccharata proteae CBS 121410]|uniref:Heterokaryon incompatibility domain-containing protein n=1 Tax=Saccharata proteae CBS 121410 TaxID=1314787 RepID=A0A6A5YDT3_9PEZI|nr:hypothetical protein K490DRAFT_72379 [Saccharata proteae CBS 121410]
MIRLATLLPGDWTDEICCTLRSAQLELHPEYTALSYAWGSANVTRTIWLNQQRFPVTVNLAAALRRLRKADTEVTLWADAICINQANHMERTAQVKLMRRIFEGASEVVLDLGETQDQRHGSMRAYMEPKPASNIFSFEESEIALVASFKERYLSGTIFCLLRSLADPRQMEDLPEITESMGNPPVTRFQRALFESLRLMMRCRWWNRMWTIQEVIVPNYLKVVYGSSVAPWKMFVEAAKHWRVLSSCLPREHTNVLKLFARVVLDIDQMRETWSQGSQTTLLPLLRQFSDRGATDDRDRVYALLSLPDYSIHTAKVFENTVLNIIHTTGSLDVLSLDVGRKNRQDLPSWVPDWTATIDQVDRRRSLSFNVHRATLQSKIGRESGSLRH